MVFKIDAKGLEKFAKQLGDLGKDGFRHAVRNALNTAAAKTRERYVGQQGQRLVVRNTWTARGSQYTKAGMGPIGSMQSIAGNTRDYMRDVEEGGTETAKRKHIPIPTAASAGQSGAQRTRPIRRTNYMAAIQLRQAKPRNASGSRAQANLVAVKAAAKAGRRFVLLERRQGPYIAQLTGGRRRLRVRMIYDLSRKEVRWKPHAVLGAAVAEVAPQLGAIGVAELEKQAKRFGAR
jgi:hypothetical protein